MRNIFYENSLEFEINLIGYKQQGESILFFIKTGDKVAYSGLVDCYKTSNCNIVEECLGKNAVGTLDFVCWTHPHDDHTKGLEDILNKYCDAKTKFWTTDIQPKDYDLYSKESRGVYETLKSIHLSKEKDRMIVKYAKNHTTLEKLSCVGAQKYLFQIDSFAPNSTVLAERKIAGEDEKGNLYSLGLIVNFGRYYILLGGDVENTTFELLEDYEFENPIDYIKIPHHGSLTGAFIVDRMQSLNVLAPSIATSTVYRKGMIPKVDTIKKYRTWGTKEIYCTGNVDSGDRDKNEYGIVRTSFDILERREYKIETSLEKNAILII